MKRTVIILIFIILNLIFSGCEQKLAENSSIKNKQAEALPTQETPEKLQAVEAFSLSFKVQPLDEKTKKRISGISWREGSPVKLDELSYIKVAYWGFDEKEHFGELIVNKIVAQEIADIFKELYDNKFPIEKVRLVDEYESDDSKSMEDNNTSAFNFREVEGKPGILSKHAFGLAIDINPVQNPYIYKGELSPISGKAYMNRNTLKKGMIVENDICYKAFIKRGWQWGGSWKNEKDYQHFQKNVDSE